MRTSKADWPNLGIGLSKSYFRQYICMFVCDLFYCVCMLCLSDAAVVSCTVTSVNCVFFEIVPSERQRYDVIRYSNGGGI
jgi:hypothetical protein